ncbi:MAG: DUF4974 domain-containing protein [Bacteroidia bacterium]|nr:DUF4974 domain-containing protein [Bacteroidia bacterium]
MTNTPVPEHLFIRYLTDEASLEERSELVEWLAEDDGRQRIFQEWCDAWNAAHESNLSPAGNIELALSRLNKRIDADARVTTRRLWIQYAVAACLLVTSAALVGPLLIRLLSATQAPALVERTMPAGQKTTLRLSDGTLVRLNAGGSLRFPKVFEGTQREVYLNGEAYFDVAHDKKHPFVIHTGSADVQVVGTAFNVAADSSESIVTVAAGKVRVANATDQVLVEPGQQAMAGPTAIKVLKVDVASLIAWKDNVLVLDNNSIEEVSSKLTRWYGVTVTVKDKAVAACRVTGKFKMNVSKLSWRR